MSTDPIATRRRAFARDLSLILACINAPYTAAVAAFCLADGPSAMVLAAFVPSAVFLPSAGLAFRLSRVDVGDAGRESTTLDWPAAVIGAAIIVLIGHALFCVTFFPTAFATFLAQFESPLPAIVAGALVACAGSYAATLWVIGRLG